MKRYWYSEREKWEKLSCFGMVHKSLENADGKEEERQYYICSIVEDVNEFEQALRSPVSPSAQAGVPDMCSLFLLKV